MQALRCSRSLDDRGLHIGLNLACAQRPIVNAHLVNDPRPVLAVEAVAAYLVTGDASKAAAEFQKFLDHPGIVLNSPLGPLAHLGRARAFARSGDSAKAQEAYRDFLGLWKDADRDIPILKQAKAEYAKLQ